MSSLEEWRTKLNTDFPRGAMFTWKGWTDPQDDTPEFKLTAALTVWRIDEAGRPVLLFWDYGDEGKDFLVTVLTYTQLPGEPTRVRVETPEGRAWIFADTIPPSMAGEDWMGQRSVEQAAGLRGGV